MTPDSFSCSSARAPVRARFLNSLVALVVIGLVAAACGGGNGGSNAAPSGAGSSSTVAVDAALSGDFVSTRPGAGIIAAGGNPGAVQGANPCGQAAGAADPIRVAYVGANLAELDAIGLEAIVVEEPGLIISAYVNEVNFNGGIHGRCVEFVPHLWSLADPVGSFTEICTELPSQSPVVYMSLRVTDPIRQCATIGAGIPTIGLYAFAPAMTLEQSGDRLYLDDGTVEHLLSASLDVALSAEVISEGEPMGLLHGGAASGSMALSESEAILDGFGLTVAAASDVPVEFGDLQLLLAEKNVRLLEGGLSDEEAAEAQRNLEAMPPELAGLFAQMERFFLDVATQFKEAGVTAVAATADWSDMRRLIRAADLVDWHPTWVANDIQPATIVLADIPKNQAENLVLVSSRRAAGDAVPDLDQGCVTLRNAASGASPFSHRLHTDAWTFITAICDYLDVTFSALTRVRGDVNADTFVEALKDTMYDTQYGGLITFSDSDLSGAERFRVLEADPDCVLNPWGCMRSTTDWLLPVGSPVLAAG